MFGRHRVRFLGALGEIDELLPKQLMVISDSRLGFHDKKLMERMLQTSKLIEPPGGIFPEDDADTGTA